MARIAEDLDSRRRTLLEAAGRLIDKGGANSLSMRALAAETRTSPMSAYELFGSKDGLLLALLQDKQRAFVRRLALGARGGGLERFFQLVELSAVGISEDFNFYQAASFQYFSPAGTKIRKVLTADRREVIRSLLVRIEFCHFVSGLTIEDLIGHIETVYNGALFHWIMGDGDQRQFVKQFGLGCALALRAVADNQSHDYLDDQIRKYSH